MDRDAQHTPNPFSTVQARAWDETHPAPWTRPNAAEDPTVRFFWVLLVAHVTLWTILSMATQPNLPVKTLELVSLGSQPQWGYFDHAPLPAWVAYGACALFGKAAWPAYLIAQFCTATCLWAAWRIAREFLHPWTAVCAAFALEGSLQFTFYSAEPSAELFSRCWWALAILAFYWALVGNRRRHWLATAIFLALGTLSTYDTALLFGAMVVFTVFNDRARQCWDSSRPILAMMLLGLLLLPHGLWLFRHDFVTIANTVGKTPGTATGHLVNPLWYGVAQLGAFIPVIMLLAPLIRKVELDEAQEVEPDREFLRRYLVWITALPFAVMFAGSLITGAELHSMCSGGLWTYAGVALLMWSRLDEERWGWRRSILFAGAVAGAVAAGLVVHHTMLPGLRNQASPVHFPGADLARSVEGTWKKYFPDRKLATIGGTRWLAGNVSWYGSDSPKVYANLNPLESPMLSDEKLATEGGIVVWDADQPGNWAEVIQQRFPFPASYVVPEPALLKYQTRAELSGVKVAMAVISPKGVAPKIQQASATLESGSPAGTDLLTIPAPPESPAVSSPALANPAVSTQMIPAGSTDANFQIPVPYTGPSMNPLEHDAVTGAVGIQQEPVSTIPASARQPEAAPAQATPGVPAGGFRGSTIPKDSKLPVQPGETQPGQRLPGGAPPAVAPKPIERSTIPTNRNSSLFQPVPTNSGSPGLAAPFPANAGENSGIVPASGESPASRAFPSQLKAN